MALNVLPLTAVLGVSFCLFYVLLNIKIFIRTSKADWFFLTQLTAPLVLMLFIGLVVGIQHHNGTYDVLKDAYFFVKVLIYILFAYVFFRKNSPIVIIHSFVWFGVAVSIVYVFLLLGFIVFGLIDTSSVDHYRKSIPDLPYDPLISITLLLFVMPRLGVIGRHPHLFSLILSIAVFSTLSRLSLLIQIAIFAMYVKEKLHLSRGVFMLPMVAGIIGIVSLIAFVNPGKHENTVMSQLLFKISNIYTETLSSSFKDKQAIQENWRAYEAVQGVAKFALGTRTEQIIGHGFGTLTDIGFEIKLGGVLRTDIPIFHNGYIFLLVKLGVLGVALYLYFVYMVYIQLKKSRRTCGLGKLEAKKIDKMAGGMEVSIGILVFFLVAITAVFFGIFNNAIFNNLVILLIMLLLIYKSRLLLAINGVNNTTRLASTGAA